jgi:hypothetical protein
MPKEGKSSQFVVLKSMFLSGSVKKMKDIEKIYPTLVSKTLRINHSRYIQKLYNPQEFTIQHLIALSNLLDLDIQLIWEVILKQIGPSLKSRKK